MRDDPSTPRRTVRHPRTAVDHPYPVVGDDVYVPSSLYLTHGEDDFHGGLCEIAEVVEHPSGQVFVVVREKPDTQLSWLYLIEQQAELKAQYGDARGPPDPDYRPEFNEGF